MNTTLRTMNGVIKSSSNQNYASLDIQIDDLLLKHSKSVVSDLMTAIITFLLLGS